MQQALPGGPQGGREHLEVGLALPQLEGEPHGGECQSGGAGQVIEQAPIERRQPLVRPSSPESTAISPTAVPGVPHPDGRLDPDRRGRRRPGLRPPLTVGQPQPDLGPGASGGPPGRLGDTRRDLLDRERAGQPLREAAHHLVSVRPVTEQHPDGQPLKEVVQQPEQHGDQSGDGHDTDERRLAVPPDASR